MNAPTGGLFLRPNIYYRVNGEVRNFLRANFPGGEVHVSTNREPAPEYFGAVAIVARLRNSDDVMALLVATDALRRTYPNARLVLKMPYIPYARQDRVCNEGEALGIRVFSDLINAQNYSEVVVYDPHSDVAPALIDRCRIVSVSTIFDQSGLTGRLAQEGIPLVAPDAGATKKVSALARLCGVRFVRADKLRDPKTGDITGTEVYGNVQGSKVMIVDDICDGGRTFIELAKVLRERGAKTISLYVTHGIFSKGVGCVLEHVDYIYTTDSITNITGNSDRVSIIKLTR